MSPSLKPLLSVLLFSLLSLGGGESLTLEEFKSYKETLVKDLAEKARELYGHGKDLVRSCECSKHACSNDFDGVTCVDHLPVPDFCPNNKRRVDHDDIIVRTPPETDPENLSVGIKEDICIFKHMLEFAKEKYPNEYGWMYIGTRNGAFIRYPASARRRETNIDSGVDQLLGNCRSYDPRIRPWYVAAATGPKDVVILVDKSLSMLDPIEDGVTRWDLAKKSVQDILDTFTFTDFISIVTFANDAESLIKGKLLLQGSEENIDELKAAIEDVKPEGGSDFSVGFKKAFELLNDGCLDFTCSNCQKVILFLSDGDNNAINGEQSTDSYLFEEIQRQQENTEKNHGNRVSIFTYSISDKSNDQLPRQIACQNEGAWSLIDPHENPRSALNSYYLYLAAIGGADSPVWVNSYEDASDLGLVTTVAMPIYLENDNLERVLIGVAAHTVALHELEGWNKSAEEVLREIVQSSKACPTRQKSNLSGCARQIFRVSSNSRSECPGAFRVNDDKPLPTCFKAGEYFYQKSRKNATWSAAKRSCEREKGSLVSVGSPEELRLLATMASGDGSWIGLRRSGMSFEWLDSSIDHLPLASDYWGYPIPVTGEGECVVVDTRGVTGNLAAKSCKESRTFICKHSAACSNFTEIDDETEFEPPSAISCAKEAQFVGDPIEEAEKLLSSRVLCSLGIPATNEDVICCLSSEDDSCSTLCCWLLVPSLVALVVLVVLLSVFIKVARATKSNPFNICCEEESSDETVPQGTPSETVDTVNEVKGDISTGDIAAASGSGMEQVQQQSQTE